MRKKIEKKGKKNLFLNGILAVLISLPGLSFLEGAHTGSDQLPPLSGDYLGQKATGNSAQLFAPGIISTGLNERDTALSPEGKELYFTVLMKNRGFIIVMKQENGKWSQPEVASFSGRYSDLEPAFSPDGKKLFFVSNRPLSGEGEPKQDYDIWFMERTGKGWGKPQNPGAPLNSPANEFYPSVTRSGAVYFCARLKESIGGEDIFRSQRLGDNYSPPENPGDAINTKEAEFNAFVAPDEGYIIYTTTGRGPGQGGGDLWINFRQQDGTWTKAINMGETVNSPALEYCPFVTADGKFLFFTSQRGMPSPEPQAPMTYDAIKRMSNQYGNGNGDLYWISTKIFAAIKQNTK